MAPIQSFSLEIPSSSQIRSVTQEKFGVRACLWQLKVAEALLKGDHDVLCTAGTGMGKTLAFWMPLLFHQGIQIVITPLNMLGKQNAASLTKAGIKAISISSETATPANFAAIRALKYRAVPVSPEQIMKPNGEFEKLLKNDLFVTQIISVIIDEVHCLTDWGEFRPEYEELGRLCYILPSIIPIMIASATLTKYTLTNALTAIRRSTGSPKHKDWVGWKREDGPPPKFLIFFDDIQDAINATRSLRKRLPSEFSNKIKWFNSEMLSTYCYERREFATGTWIGALAKPAETSGHSIARVLEQ
ncbi:P-loop containing nucleoside triphosphate hydrolase protein [Suillus subluteus]|nr:P-loop containing nucleoside triphosphate hydrolase protein [Suillus subluteus]